MKSDFLLRRTTLFIIKMLLVLHNVFTPKSGLQIGSGSIITHILTFVSELVGPILM